MSDREMIIARPARRVVAASSLLIMLAIVTAGCDRSDHKVPDRPIPADEVVDFNELYSQNCAGCHGADGLFGPAPPLNDALFLAIVPDDVIARLVNEGRPGTPMPGFARKKGGTLTDEQVKVLATGVKVRWKSAQVLPPNLPTYIADKPANRPDKDRGLLVFTRACAPCHGPIGEGVDKKAGAIHDPAFLALISDQALRRYIITGRPDLGMPSFAEHTQRHADFEPLKSQEIADLVALLVHWRRSETVPQKTSALTQAR